MTGTIVPNPNGSTDVVAAGPPIAPPKVASQSAPPSVALSSIQGDLPDETPDLLQRQRIPAWVISTFLHVVVFIILAFWTYQHRGGQVLSLQASQGEAANAIVSFQMAESKIEEVQTEDALAERPVEVNISQQEIEITTTQSPTQTTSSQIPKLDLQAIGGGSTSNAVVRLPGGGLEGRSPEGRKKFGERFGATPQSESAVDRALDWIVRHQRPNGSWSFNLDLDPCNGRCRHSKDAGDTATPSTGATGLALLALLGAGHTHHSGPYAKNIRQAIYYLRDAAGLTDEGYDWQQGSMYGHGIALMAIGELCTMTRSEDGAYESDLKDMVERGAAFTQIAQHPNGSWGYVPGSPGDTTLTGWQVLSLIAARRNGVRLRSYTLPRAKEYLQEIVGNDEFEFGYKGPPAEPTTTAIGLTLMLYLGQSPDNTIFRESLTRMAKRGPTKTNVYHDYYATLALHHARHRLWEQWNSELQNHLVRSQVKEGHEAGSWHFDDRWGNKGGRLYTTAMCTMMLEVYYRYMPLYDEDTSEFPL